MRRRSKDSYLLNSFTVANTFSAHIILRLQAYADASNINLESTTEQYCHTILNNVHMQAWQKEALREIRIITENEAGEILSTLSAQ